MEKIKCDINFKYALMLMKALQLWSVIYTAKRLHTVNTIYIIHNTHTHTHTHIYTHTYKYNYKMLVVITATIYFYHTLLKLTDNSA